MASSVDELVARWLDLDVDPETRKEIEQLYSRVGEETVQAELRGRLSRRIAFGTAGLFRVFCASNSFSLSILFS